MSTIVDVARLAGVSTSTVSHVLNATRPVEPATRERVMQAIAATNYRQDALARAMRRSRTETVGLVVSDVGEPAFAGMIHGVERAAGDAGMSLLLASSAESADLEQRAIDTLLNRRVDGLILARAVNSHDGLLARLAAEKTPIVLIDRIYSRAGADQVGVDNAGAVRKLTDHLVAAGHRRLAMVAGDLDVPTLRERHDGFLAALASTGATGTSLSGTDDALRLELRELLAHGGTTAIIAASTPLATIALDEITDAGLRIPQDVAFATFDGFDQHRVFEPRLTTIRQPAFTVGTEAVRMLLARLADPARESETIRLEPELDLQASTEGYRFG